MRLPVVARCPVVVLSVFALGALGLGCSSRGDDPTSSAPPPPPAAASCAGDARIMTFASGLSTKDASGRFVAEIVTASPSPPIKGMNAWTLRFTEGGQPLQGTLSVRTLMPDHGHGSARTPTVVANPDGTHTVSDLYLSMGGVWEISFADSASVNARATFSICVQ